MPIPLLDGLRFTFTGDPLALARMTGRPYWSLLYRDGTVINEWDADSSGKKVDWLTIPYRGRQAIRLYCPNGQMAELHGPTDATGLCFQFKRGEMSTSRGHRVLAHVIGLITGTDGQCVLRVWEPGQGLLPPLLDNANHLAYGHVGPLCAAHLGIAAGEGA